MSAMDWERTGAELRAIRRDLERLGVRPIPTVLDYAEAARQLGITERALHALVRTHAVVKVMIGDEPGIAVSEIQRIKPSMGGPASRPRRVPAKVRARLKAASLKRRNAKR